MGGRVKRVRNNRPLRKSTVTIYYDAKLPTLPYSNYVNSKRNYITYPSSVTDSSSEIVLNDCAFVNRKYYVMESEVLTLLSSKTSP